MTILAISLYLLGIFGAAASIAGDVTPSYRKWIVVIAWPVVTLCATVWGLFTYVSGGYPR